VRAAEFPRQPTRQSTWENSHGQMIRTLHKWKELLTKASVVTQTRKLGKRYVEAAAFGVVLSVREN